MPSAYRVLTWGQLQPSVPSFHTRTLLYPVGYRAVTSITHVLRLKDEPDSAGEAEVEALDAMVVAGAGGSYSGPPPRPTTDQTCQRLVVDYVTEVHTNTSGKKPLFKVRALRCVGGQRRRVCVGGG